MGQSVSKTFRRDYLAQLPAEEERRMLVRLYAQHDQAIAQWKETLKEVERVGKDFWEVARISRLPGGADRGPRLQRDPGAAGTLREQAQTPEIQ